MKDDDDRISHIADYFPPATRGDLFDLVAQLEARTGRIETLLEQGFRDVLFAVTGVRSETRDVAERQTATEVASIVERRRVTELAEAIEAQQAEIDKLHKAAAGRLRKARSK